MGTNVTCHKVNWIYNCQKGKKTSYCLKCIVPSVRLISCIPESNKVWTKISSSSRVNGMMVCTTLPKMGNQVGYPRPQNNLRLPSLVILPFLPSNFFLVIFAFKFYFILTNSFSFFVFSADEFHTVPNKNIVNFTDLNWILQLEIFLHRDGQLRVVHVILGFKPISTRFQSPKHVVKAKNLRLVLIDVVVPSFLIKPPPSGTQDA